METKTNTDPGGAILQCVFDAVDAPRFGIQDTAAVVQALLFGAQQLDAMNLDIRAFPFEDTLETLLTEVQGRSTAFNSEETIMAKMHVIAMIARALKWHRDPDERKRQRENANNGYLAY